MKMKCLIVEDEPIAQEILRSYIEKIDFLEISAQLTNAIDAFNFLQQNEIQLLFLDIKMPQMTGIELLKSISNKPKVIITSAYRYYATDAYDLDVIDYLLKPYPFERFLKSLSKVRSDDSPPSVAVKPTGSEKAFIFVKGNKQLHKVYIDNIIYIESQRDYLRFKMVDQADIVTRQTMGYYEQFLPGNLFIRIHRSFIVAVDKISLVEATRLTVGGTALPIGRNYKQHVQESLKSISF